jgi:hypothetical protein
MSTVLDVNPNELFTPKQSFVQRLINIQITFSGQINGQPINAATAGGSPGGPTAGTTLSISGKRTRAVVREASGLANNTAEIWVYGLAATILNQASTCGISYDFGTNNSIKVSAGDSVSGMVQVFQGIITYAIPDYNKQPDVPLYIQCAAGGGNLFGKKVASFTGSTDVATMMQGFATSLGIQNFENNNINIKIANPYFSGSTWSQVQQLAQHAYINAAIVDSGNTLAIWPKGGRRVSQTNVPLVSPQTGMIGYPTFAADNFLHVKTLFNPSIKMGANIQIQSSIPQANATWTVWHQSLMLESLVPHGQWMEEILCRKVGQITSGSLLPSPT